MTYAGFIDSIKESRENVRFENSECHHILPRCLGGNDDPENLIYLTYREHFIAHKLLVDENLDNSSIFYAYWRMCNGRTDQATPEEYEEAKLRFSNMNKGNTYNKGRTFTEEHRKRISNSLKGHIQSEEHISKLSNSRRGNEFSQAHREALSKSHQGNKLSEETRKKIARAHIGKSVSEETRKKMSEGCKSRKFHRICKRCNQEFLGNSSNEKYCSDCKGGI